MPSKQDAVLTYFRALTIAGSDSGGGAGIQADLKTFAAHNVYGMSAITAVTAQNTRQVTAVHEIPAEVVAAQIDADHADVEELVLVGVLKGSFVFLADLARRITVRHCSIYGVPRAGINVSEGNWGGHRIEHCDVFDTVRETGDHGSFNSWGRDRYWRSDHLKASQAAVDADRKLPFSGNHTGWPALPTFGSE